MKKYLLMIFLLMSASFAMNAQIQVKGVVTESGDDGQPLVANVGKTYINSISIN